MVSRNPLQRREPERDEQLETPFGMTFEDDAPKPEEKAASEAEARYKKLEDELARLHEQLETRESRDFTVLTQNPIQQDVFIPEKFMDVPNVNDDLDGYIKAQASNVLIADRNERRKRELDTKNSQTIEEKVDALWDEFGEQYPDLAEDRTRVDFVAQTVAKRAAARGLDPQRYMFVTRDRFLKDVAKEYVAIFGEPEEEEDEEVIVRPRGRKARDATRRRTRRAPREEDNDYGRTDGIPGGSSAGNRMSSRDVSGDSAGNMMDEIHAMQKRGGFL